VNSDNDRARDILLQTAEAVGGPRGQTHGSIKVQHECAAELISTYLALRTLHGKGSPIDARDVCVVQILLKLSRTICGDPKNPDHWLDIAGYAAGAAACVEAGK
jgi:hypothetical protein